MLVMFPTFQKLEKGQKGSVVDCIKRHIATRSKEVGDGHKICVQSGHRQRQGDQGKDRKKSLMEWELWVFQDTESRVMFTLTIS